MQWQVWTVFGEQSKGTVQSGTVKEWNGLSQKGMEVAQKEPSLNSLNGH